MKLPAKDNSDYSPKNRFMLTRLLWHVLQIYTPKHPDNGENKIILSLGRGAGKPMAIDLTRFTEQELIAFKETVLIATEAAQPICAELDRRAQEAMEDEDPNPRTYRPLPVVFIRPRAFGKYDKRLLDGHQNVLQGVQFNLMQSNGTAEPGGDLDEQGEIESNGTKDNP